MPPFTLAPCRSCRKPAYGVRCRPCTDRYLRWLDGGAGVYAPEYDGVQDLPTPELPPIAEEPEE